MCKRVGQHQMTRTVSAYYCMVPSRARCFSRSATEMRTLLVGFQHPVPGCPVQSVKCFRAKRILVSRFSFFFLVFVRPDPVSPAADVAETISVDFVFHFSSFSDRFLSSVAVCFCLFEAYSAVGMQLRCKKKTTCEQKWSYQCEHQGRWARAAPTATVCSSCSFSSVLLAGAM